MDLSNGIPKIKCKDIKRGDIMLFHGTDGGIEGLIRKITLSDVSHAAICITEGETVTIAEETKGGIRTRLIADNMDDLQYAYVKRLKEPFTMEPVISTANGYLLQHIPFAYTQMPLLLLILLFRKIPLNPTIKRYVFKITEVIAAEMMHVLNKSLYGDKTPMVCSEFVYICYDDAAKMTKNDAYKLDVKSEFDTDSPVTLHSLCLNHFLRNSDTTIHRIPNPELQFHPENKIEDLNGLCNELIREIDDANTDTDGNIEKHIDTEHLHFVHKIGTVLHKYNFASKNTKVKSDLPSSLTVLNNIMQYFVTPDDLLNRCSNTTLIGTAGK